MIDEVFNDLPLMPYDIYVLHLPLRRYCHQYHITPLIKMQYEITTYTEIYVTDTLRYCHSLQIIDTLASFRVLIEETNVDGKVICISLKQHIFVKVHKNNSNSCPD